MLLAFSLGRENVDSISTDISKGQDWPLTSELLKYDSVKPISRKIQCCKDNDTALKTHMLDVMIHVNHFSAQEVGQKGTVSVCPQLHGKTLPYQRLYQ